MRDKMQRGSLSDRSAALLLVLATILCHIHLSSSTDGTGNLYIRTYKTAAVTLESRGSVRSKAGNQHIVSTAGLIQVHLVAQ